MNAPDTPDVRLSIHDLDRPDPCMVTRRPGKALITYNSTALRVDIVAWLLDHCTEYESRAVAAGYGYTFPLPNWTTARLPVMLWVPQPLRLPNRIGLASCAEFRRRQGRNDLTMERAAWRAERLGRTIDLQIVHELTAV